MGQISLKLFRKEYVYLPGTGFAEAISGVSSARTTARPVFRCQSMWLTVWEINVNNGKLSHSVILNADVPVEEPRSRVVCHEADDNDIADDTSADHVTADRVGVVCCQAPRATNDAEDVSVQMERMLPANIRRNFSRGSDCAKQTYRTSADGGSHTSMDGDLNDLVGRQAVDGSSGQQSGRGARAAENLQEDGDAGRDIWHAVDSELEGRRILGCT
jgi:hypothetical protein